MSTQPFSPETSVSEALAAGRVAEVFIGHHTACVGCYLARFCTLSDVARTYSLPLDVLLDELQRAAHARPYQLTGANHDK